MKNLILSSAAVLCVAASIFGGYYFFSNDDLQPATVSQSPEGMEATENIGVEYRRWALLNEDGEIDPNGVANAIAQRDHYLAQHLPTHGFGINGTAKDQKFSPIGPTNLGGRTEAILVDPTNPTTIWAGGASGGVWVSYNAGHRWRAVNGELGNYNVSCLALDPGDATGRTLYAGTGAHDLRGDGIFRSVDSGLNWKRIYGHQEGWKYVSSISIVHVADGTPRGKTIILAAVDNDLSDPDEEQGIIRGVITSNDPDGAWTEVQDGTQGNAVAFDPNDPSKAVASVCYDGNYPDASLSNKCKAFYSTNYGVNWTTSSLTRGTNSDPGCPPTGEFKTCQAEDSIHFALQKSAPGSGQR